LSPNFASQKWSSCAAAVIVKLFHGLPQAYLLGVPFRVKRGLGKEIFLIACRATPAIFSAYLRLPTRHNNKI
jgi:hypothetical protein